MSPIMFGEMLNALNFAEGVFKTEIKK